MRNSNTFKPKDFDSIANEQKRMEQLMTGLRKKPLKYSWLGATAENSPPKDSKLKQIEETPQLHKFHIEPREKRIILTAQAIKSGGNNTRF